MALGAANVVPPVFAAAEVVVFFPTRMTGQAGFRTGLGGLVFEGNDLLWIAVLAVRFAWSMTGLTARDLALPAF